jgi:hypothetical protein
MRISKKWEWQEVLGPVYGEQKMEDAEPQQLENLVNMDYPVEFQSL